MRHVLLLLILPLLLASCTEMRVMSHIFKKNTGGYKCVPTGEGPNKVGNPYTIMGQRYTPQSTSAGYDEQGIASWYGADFHGRPTANGECYDMYGVSAAHPTLPIPTIVRVTNLTNNKSITLRINDRGPYAKGRIIDLSYGAAKKLGMVKAGVSPVRVTAIGGAYHSASRVAKKQVQPVQPKTAPTVAAPALKRTPSTTGYRLQAMRSEAETPPEVPAKTSNSVLPNTRLFVQTGAFSSQANAQRQAGRVKQVFTNVQIKQVQRAGRTLYRVQVGPYNTVLSADAALADLVDAGFNTAIIAVENK